MAWAWCGLLRRRVPRVFEGDAPVLGFWFRVVLVLVTVLVLVLVLGMTVLGAHSHGQNTGTGGVGGGTSPDEEGRARTSRRVAREVGRSAIITPPPRRGAEVSAPQSSVSARLPPERCIRALAELEVVAQFPSVGGAGPVHGTTRQLV